MIPGVRCTGAGQNMPLSYDVDPHILGGLSRAESLIKVVCIEQSLSPGFSTQDACGPRGTFSKDYLMSTITPRVDPLSAPFADELQAIFDQINPPGLPLLALFTTLARVPRIFDRLRAGTLFDRGPISLRYREIVINRTCARCGCTYEWGVHVALFAQRVALTPEQTAATVLGNEDEAVWSDEEKLLIRLVDELHDKADLSDELWDALARAFTVEHIFELIALVGFYHSVSFFANSLRLGPEPFAETFPLR